MNGHARYSQTEMMVGPHGYCICRVLGNDLPPRHGLGQTLTNLKFILDHEPKFENSTRLWVVNRIIDQKAEADILTLLDERGEAYMHLPFTLEGYDITWETDRKLNHIIQLNKARNSAADRAQHLARWIIMADGGIFFTQEGWNIVSEGLQLEAASVHKIEVYRLMKDNTETLRFDPALYKVEAEQMLAYLPEAKIRFDENMVYGKREKKVLLDALPDAPMTGYCLRLHDFSRFGFINELRSVQRIKAVHILVQKVDMLYKNISGQ